MEDTTRSSKSTLSLASLPILTGKANYMEWRRAIEDYIGLAKLSEVCFDNRSPNAPEREQGETQARFDKRKSAWEEKREEATISIRNRVAIGPFNFIRNEQSPCTMLKTLDLQYKPQGSGTFHELCKKFYALRLADCKDVGEYTDRIRKIDNELKTLSSQAHLPECFLIEKYLSGLSSAYNVFLSVFSQTSNIIGVDPAKPQTTFDEVIMAVVNEEEHQNSLEQRSENTVVAMMSKTVSGNARMVEVKHCTTCDKDYHTTEECFVAHPHLKAAHDKKMAARKRKRDSVGTSISKKAKEDSTGASPGKDASPDSSIQVFTAYMAPNSTMAMSELWLLDSACTRHVSNQRHAFETYTLLDPNATTIIKGIGGGLKPVGRGTVLLDCTLNSGKTATIRIQDVLHHPNIPANLISVTQLLRAGAAVAIESDASTVTLGDTTLQFTHRAGLPVLDRGHPNDQNAFSLAAYTTSNPTLNLWHERLGHLGEQNVSRLEKMSFGIDLKKRFSNPECLTCEPCVLGRQISKPHLGHIRPGQYPLELVHSDVKGPLPHIGYRGEKYWVTFLCDKTKFAVLYMIKRKSDVIDCFWHYKKHHERGEFTIRRFRTDTGGEFDNNAFKATCLQNGIMWEPNTTDQPEQNGAAEALNKTMYQKLFPTLISSEIPYRYWPEVLRTMTYLRNRSPVASLDVTPFEAMTGAKPHLGHVRTLGSIAYAMKPGRQRALYERSVRCILVGYDGDHIYRLLHPTQGIIRSSNVHIEEKLPRSLLSERATVQDTELSSAENILNSSAISPSAAGESDDNTGERIADNISRNSGTDRNTQQSLPISRQLRSSTMMQRITANQDDGSNVSGQRIKRTSQGVAANPTSQDNAELDSRSFGDHTYSSVNSSSMSFMMAFLSHANEYEPYEPRTFEAATGPDVPNRKQWESAMTDEYSSLIENDTWSLVDPPLNRKVLRGRWVYKVKRGSEGEITRYKARWVVRGYEQEQGTDFHETFASVVKPMSYKAIFVIAAAKDYEIEQMDVKTAFLYGEIDCDNFVQQPMGYDDGSARVCHLKKALYGLRQAPRVWYETLSNFLKSIGFVPLISDPGVFIHPDKDITIAVYVDDLLLTGPVKSHIEVIKNQLSHRFRMTDLGACHYYLGISIIRDRPNRIIRLSQASYCETILRQFGLWECKTSPTPMDTGHLTKADEDYEAPSELRKRYQSAVGSLMYLMLGTRPDIAHAVSVVSRFSSNPSTTHWTAVQRIFRYLRGTLNLVLTFSGELGLLTGYADSDWAADRDTRRSTSGYIFNVGSGAISWSSKRQPTVATSTCEAEYVSQNNACKEAIWLSRLLRELNPEDDSPAATIIYCDNQGAIALARNPQHHGRSKHIDIGMHWQRERLAAGDVDLQYISTDQQVADGLTKALPKDKFFAFRKALGLEPF